MNDRLGRLLQLYHQGQNRTKQLFVYVNRLLFLERIFLLFIILLFIYLFWYLVLMLPIQRTQGRLKTRMLVSERQVKNLERRTKAIIKEALTEGKRNKERYQKLGEEVKILDSEIRGLNKNFITASEMARTLRETLDKQGRLRLRDLTTLPVKVIIKSEGDEQPLIEQGVTFTFQGRYFDTLTYLEKLEGLKKQLFWSNLKYDVVKYPESDITVTLFLLKPPKRVIRDA